MRFRDGLLCPPISAKNPPPDEEEDDDGDVPLFDATIGDKRRMTIPKDALPLVPWRAQIKGGAGVTFEFMDKGRVRLLPGPAYDAAVASAKGDPEMLAHIRMVLLQRKWATKNSVVIPRRVATHVLGAHTLAGALYVWAGDGELVLWSDERRLLELSRSRSIASEHLPE